MDNIEETVIEKKVYLVNGNQFNTKEEAENYISIKSDIHGRSYYHVDVGLDSQCMHTEELLISTKSGFANINILLDYLVRKFGNPLIVIYGYAVNTYTIKGPYKFDELEDPLGEKVEEKEFQFNGIEVKNEKSSESTKIRKIEYIHLNDFGADLHCSHL